MKLKIRKINKQKGKFWDNLLITMIWLYDENDKWIKWVKLNDEIIDILENNYINLN